MSAEVVGDEVLEKKKWMVYRYHKKTLLSEVRLSQYCQYQKLETWFADKYPGSHCLSGVQETFQQEVRKQYQVIVRQIV